MDGSNGDALIVVADSRVGMHKVVASMADYEQATPSRGHILVCTYARPELCSIHLLALALVFFFSSRRRHTRSVSAFLLNRSSDLKSGMVNITSSVNSRERSGINTILHELNPLFTINVTMRDIKSKNVYSRVNSKATTQWRKTESA